MNVTSILDLIQSCFPYCRRSNTEDDCATACQVPFDANDPEQQALCEIEGHFSETESEVSDTDSQTENEDDDEDAKLLKEPNFSLQQFRFSCPQLNLLNDDVAETCMGWDGSNDDLIKFQICAANNDVA